MNRKNLSAAILVVMWVCTGRLSAADEPWLAYAATKIEKPPVIDGRLDDPCWQSIERTRPMVCIGGAAAPVATTGMACWDDKNLYLGLVCPEPDMAAVRQKEAEGRLRPFLESVEIFLVAAHDHFSCLQFRVDVAGNRDTYEGEDRDKSLDQRWSGAAARASDRWTVEMAVPWKLVASGRPDEKTVWGMNLNRNRSIESEGMWGGCTCWSDTKGPFNSPSRFGDVVFFPYPVFLRSYFSTAFDSSYREMEELNRRSPTAAADSKTRLAAIKQADQRFLKSLESAAIVRGQDAAAPYARGMEQQRKLALLQDVIVLQTVRDLASTPGNKP
jgi:hypothetical protein